MALLFEGYLHRFQRELRHVEAASAQLLSLSEHGFAYACDSACGLIGWARAQLGRTVEGISLIRQALAGIEKSGALRTDANPREREWRSDRAIGSGRIVGGFYPSKARYVFRSRGSFER
jgi:hypothetical protein